MRAPLMSTDPIDRLRASKKRRSDDHHIFAFTAGGGVHGETRPLRPPSPLQENLKANTNPTMKGSHAPIPRALSPQPKVEPSTSPIHQNGRPSKTMALPTTPIIAMETF